MGRRQDDQLRILAQRFKSLGMSRRNFMKIAAAAAAGTVTTAGMERYVGPGAGAAPRRLPRLQATPSPDQTFYNFVLIDDPVSFDWNLNLYCNAEPEIAAGLLTFDADLNAIPDWAETFTPNDDASVWTFNIRKDNNGWTNGTDTRPVTAHDFIFSWERQLNPANAAAYAGFLFDIKNAEKYNLGEDGITADDLGIKALDDWTLEVTMEGPRAYFPQVVGYVASVPSAQWAVEEYGSDKWASGDVPLWSNGPFILDKWEHDVVCELSPNPGYWDAENISLKKVYDPILAGDTTVLAYERGEGTQKLDWVPIPAADLKRFQDDPELSQQLKKYVYPGIWMLVPSNGKEPFQFDETGLKVRQALSHAVDRSRLVELTNGLAREAFCMVPTGVYGYIDDPAIAEIQAFDPKKAMELLQGTPYEGGKNWPEITMHMRGGEENYNADLMANDIVAQLQENLGMNVSIQVWPEASWRPELFKNEFQLVWIRWWYDYPDPNNGYGDMFYSQKSSGKRQAWSNKEFDDLVVQGKGIADPEARLEVYKKAEEVIQNDVGYIPVVYRVDQYAFKPWVKNVAVNRQGFSVPDGNIYLRMMTVVDIEGREGQ
ncbi:MAG: peptide ABC transporter substrate-binding protein [Thermomicrobiales bacterium]|nr:peptide ABC transporter substrate-binding protein [Thermomicrobiales bacterium]